MAHVLVTGASGFIGGHLAQALAGRGDQVRCLVRPTSRVDHLRASGMEFVQADIAHPLGLEQAVRGVDVVFHLAALTSALRARDLMRVNATGVTHLARACARRQTPPVFVLVSSIAASGPTPRGRLRRESDPPAPVSHYGCSKRAGELAAAQWAHAMPVSVVRPGIVFGPRNRELFPVFQAIHATRIHVVTGWTLPPLSLIHVADLVDILLRAAERGARIESETVGQASSARGYYFACDDVYPNYAELGRSIATALGYRRILTFPVAGVIPWLVAGASQSLDLLRRRSSSLNIDKMRDAMADSWACSNQSVRESLGFSFPASLDARLRETAAWYREHGWL